MSEFPAHGRLVATIEGRILVADHTGPFNVEYWRKAQTVIWPMIEELEESGPFGILIAFHASALSSVEAMEVIIERNRGFAYAHPLCAGIAIAADLDVEGWGIMQPQAERYFAALGAAPATTGTYTQRDLAYEFLIKLIGKRLGPGGADLLAAKRHRHR